MVKLNSNAISISYFREDKDTMKKLLNLGKKVYYFCTLRVMQPVIQFLAMLLIKVLKAFKKNSDNKTLILTQDRIGDTVIKIKLLEKYNDFFENSYFVVSNSNYEIVSQITKNIIVVDERKMNSRIIYAWKIMFKLNLLNFTKLISTVPKNVFGSELLFDKYLLINEKIYNEDIGGTEYVLESQVKLYNLATNENLSLEDVKPNLIKYIKQPEQNKVKEILNKEYIVINMGAFDKGRMYPAEKFDKVIDYLIEKNETMVFLGRGKSDSDFFDSIIQGVSKKNQVINYIDKLNIMESFYVISNAKLFIGVESGMWNSSYALNVPSVVIYGGGHFGRFMHKNDKIGYVYKAMDCFKCNWICKYGNILLESAKCIRDIEPEQIIEVIENINTR